MINFGKSGGSGSGGSGSDGGGSGSGWKIGASTSLVTVPHSSLLPLFPLYQLFEQLLHALDLLTSYEPACVIVYVDECD